MDAFTPSEAPLSALAGAYVGGAMPEVLALVAAVSAIGAGLGCACVGARTIFALARDRGIRLPLSRVSANGAPAVGLGIVLGFDLVGLVAFAVAGTEPMRVFFYFATIGVLSLLCMYVLTNVAAVRFLLARGGRGEALLPVLGIAVAAYVLYRNVWPVPDPPFDVFPYIVAVWLVLGVTLAWLRPPPARAVADRA